MRVVVGSGAPLPEKVPHLLAELRFSRASGCDVGLVVRCYEDIQLRERTALDAVEVFGEEEVEPHEHHHVVGRLRRTIAQPLQTRDFALQSIKWACGPKWGFAPKCRFATKFT